MGTLGRTEGWEICQADLELRCTRLREVTGHAVNMEEYR